MTRPLSPRALLAIVLLGGGLLISAFGPTPSHSSAGSGSATAPNGTPLSPGRPAAEASAQAAKNYRVIFDTDLQRLVTNVHEAMVGGWQVAGGVAVYVSEGKVRYAQAMTGN